MSASNKVMPLDSGPKRLDARVKRRLREAKRNPEADDSVRALRHKTQRLHKPRLKDVAFDDLKTWEKADEDS